MIADEELKEGVMNILFVASEAVPFIKTGGLADVAGSLPKALNKLGMDCRVTLPLYSAIDDKFKKDMVELGHFDVNLGWKREYCGIKKLDYEGVTYYFLDSQYYFNRFGIYGQGDDYERFIFFSKAATRLPRILDWPVDVIHANDWHSALVPVFVNDYRTGDDFYKDVRTLFTIHNLKYQGQFAPEVFYWTNLNPAFFSDYDLKFYDSINFMKGGIVHATKVNTVSPSYSEEIRYPFFAEGLENVINAYDFKISGILNGIDYQVWDPATDDLIPYQFSPDQVEGKVRNKTALQEAYHLPVRKDVPLLAMVSRLTAMKGLDLLRYILDDLLQKDIQLVVLGTGEAQYEDMFRYYAYKYPDKMSARIYYDNDESHKVYAASDLYLMPSISEPCGLSQMIAMRYGAVPVVREAGGLRDSVPAYNKYEETGVGFSFANINADEFREAIEKALTIYWEEPESFAGIRQRAMTKDFSWDRSSRQYIELYQSLF